MCVSTDFPVAAIPPRMGRPRINAIEGDKMTARFPEGWLERMRATLAPGEKLSDFTRTAVERELQRREGAQD